MLLTFVLIIISIPSPSLFHHMLKTFFLQILPTVAFLFFFGTDYMDSPHCLLTLLSLSVFFYFLVFSVFYFLVVGSVR